MIPGNDSGVGKLGHFEFLGSFDSTIEKAVKVANRKDMNDNKSMYGKQVWLMILKLLHQFGENGKKHLRQDPSTYQDKVVRLDDFL